MPRQCKAFQRNNRVCARVKTDILSAVLSLCGLLMYSRCAHLTHTTWLWFTCAVAVGLLSTLSKEVGISTLAMFVVYDALAVAQGRAATHHPSPALTAPAFLTRSLAGLCHPPVLLRTLCVVTVGVVFMRWRLALHAGAPLYTWTILENQFSIMPAGASRTLSICYTHVRYAVLFLWPVRLSFDHGFAAATPLAPDVQWATVSPFVLYLGVVGWGVWMVVRNRTGQLMCLAWAIGSFLPASNVFVFVGTEVAERLLYFPSMGLCVLCAHYMLGEAVGAVAPAPGSTTQQGAEGAEGAEGAAGTGQLAGGEGKCHDPSSPLPPVVGPVEGKAKRDSANALLSHPAARRTQTGGVSLRRGVALVVLALLALRTQVRNLDWSSEQRLFESALATHPRSLKALNNVGLMLLNGNATQVCVACCAGTNGAGGWCRHRVVGVVTPIVLVCPCLCGCVRGCQRR